MSMQDQASPQHSVLSTQQSSDEPGALAAFGALLLIAALVTAILLSWDNPTASSRYDLSQASDLLSQGHYSEAVSQFERLLPIYPVPQTYLGLSYAYLARRDGPRAERQARLAVDSASADLKPAAWAQLGRALAFEGQTDAALDAWSKTIQSAQPYLNLAPIKAEARSATWHIAITLWARGDFDSARPKLQSLLGGNDVYADSARVKLAQLLAPDDENASKRFLETVPSGVQTAPADGTITDAGPGAAIPDLRVPGLGEGLSQGTLSTLVTSMRTAYQDPREGTRWRSKPGGYADPVGTCLLPARRIKPREALP